MASFATKTKKKTHDNEYLQYLQMQLSNMDTISQRNNMISTGQPVPVAPTDNRSMAEKMKDQMYQRDMMYKNLSKLFDKNNEETSIVMSEFTTLADIVNFNNKFPELYGILSSKYAYVKGRQVIDTYNRLIKKQNEYKDVMLPPSMYVSGAPITGGSYDRDVDRYDGSIGGNENAVYEGSYTDEGSYANEGSYADDDFDVTPETLDLFREACTSAYSDAEDDATQSEIDRMIQIIDATYEAVINDEDLPDDTPPAFINELKVSGMIEVMNYTSASVGERLDEVMFLITGIDSTSAETKDDVEELNDDKDTLPPPLQPITDTRPQPKSDSKPSLQQSLQDAIKNAKGGLKKAEDRNDKPSPSLPPKKSSMMDDVQTMINSRASVMKKEEADEEDDDDDWLDGAGLKPKRKTPVKRSQKEKDLMKIYKSLVSKRR
jgi:hypothetical protein